MPCRQRISPVAASGTWNFVTAALLAATVVVAHGDAQVAPRLGEAGKDVLWLPTPEPMVDVMLDLAGVTPRDMVVDLGSGDGRLVIAAAKRGARAQGVEYNQDLVDFARTRAAAEHVAAQATFLRADLFATDLSHATVVTLFLRDDLNRKLRPRLLDLAPGTRIVSNTFSMDDWEPDDITSVERGCASWCTALMWIVPAKVQGTWRLPEGDLTLAQRFQMVNGTLRTRDGRESAIEGRMRGNQITFVVGSATYSGRVNGRAIEGTMTDRGATTRWTATR